MARVFRFLQHAFVEVQPGYFAVEEPLGRAHQLRFDLRMGNGRGGGFGEADRGLGQVVCGGGHAQITPTSALPDKAS